MRGQGFEMLTATIRASFLDYNNGYIDSVKLSKDVLTKDLFSLQAAVAYAIQERPKEEEK